MNNWTRTIENVIDYGFENGLHMHFYGLPVWYSFFKQIKSDSKSSDLYSKIHSNFPQKKSGRLYESQQLRFNFKTYSIW